MPWGASESAYNARDLELTYQYSSFGIPDLGSSGGSATTRSSRLMRRRLRRWSIRRPRRAISTRLAELGGRGRYGWYEALDYTQDAAARGRECRGRARLHGASPGNERDRDRRCASRRGDARALSCRADHPGDRTPCCRSACRTTWRSPNRGPRRWKPAPAIGEPVPSTQRQFNSPHDVTPRTHLLSNGRYAVMITAAARDTAAGRISRSRDGGRTSPAMTGAAYVFLRDMRSGEVWSAGYQPSGAEPDITRSLSPKAARKSSAHDGTITTTLEVAVSSEDDAEVRRVSITNLGSQARDIELTSYAEIVLAPHAADDAHPAFSKLFVETEFVADIGAILATRRRRSPGDPQVWAAHLAVVEGETIGAVQFETDRARFLGRGHGIRDADRHGRRLRRSPTRSAPCSIRSSAFAAVCGFRRGPPCASRSGRWSRPRATKCSISPTSITTPMAFDRATTLAWTQAQVQLHHLGIGAGEAHLFQRLANRVLYSDPTLRPASEILKRGGGPASLLWPHGISGDVPIVLVRIDETGDLEIVRQLLLAHEYWRMKQLAVDLVILNERPRPTRKICRSLSRRWFGQIHRGRNRRERRCKEAYSSCAPIWSRPKCATCSRPRPGRCSSAIAGASPSKSEGAGAQATGARRQARRRRARLARRSAAPSSGVLQWSRRIRRQRTGICDDPRRGTMDARALDQCHLQSVPSASRRRSRAAAIPGRSTVSRTTSRPWSNDPVSDAPGEVIYLRDEDSGRIMGSDGSSDPRGRARHTSLGTARAIAGSSMSRMAFRSSCCNMCRLTIRSRYPG